LCPVVESVRGADFLLLVTEPTPFGLHDLKLAAQIARELNLPAGVVINRDGIGDAGVEDFCAAERLPILMRIPFERAIAEGIAQGQTLVDLQPEYRARFEGLNTAITSRIAIG
jgi:MinD superfamily P-loop ATPase